MSNIISPAINNAIEVINEECANLSKILYNCSVLLYQQIPQTSISYAPFDNATVDYNYVPDGLHYYLYFGQNQIQTVIDFYVNNVNAVLTQINNYGLQNQLITKINSLQSSIASLNNFAVSLYEGQQNNIIIYIVPYAMSIRSALLLNNLTLNNLATVILYNMSNVYSFNYISKGTQLLLL